MITFDLRNPDHVHNPYPVFRRLRAEAPVHWSEPLGGWILTRHAEVAHVLRSDAVSADTIRPFVEARAPHDPDVARLGRLAPLWAADQGRTPRKRDRRPK